MGSLLIRLFTVLAPIASDALSHYLTKGVAPTKPEMLAIMNANADKYLTQGDAWLEAHPTTPPTP